MANKEHFKIYKQGVDAWNNWRKGNPEIEPDLSGSNLNLQVPCIIDLTEIDFSGTNLSEVDLSDAYLLAANFKKAILHGAALTGANLTGADFRGACLHAADLRDAICRHTIFSQARLTGAWIYGIAALDWKIENVECDYVYLGKNGEDRCPRDRNFFDGEFEQLYRTYPTLEFIFENGMNWVDAMIMNSIALDTSKEKPELGLELVGLERRGIYPRAVFAVASSDLKKEAEKEIALRYENKIRRLETEKDLLHDLVKSAVIQPRQITIGGDYFETHGNVQITQIEVIQAVEKIKKSVEQIPEDSFKVRSKKKILEHLDSIAKEATKETAKSVSKKLFEFAKTELIGIIPNIMTLLGKYLGTQ